MPVKKTSNESNKPDNKRSLGHYAKFSTMAFQMIAIMLLGAFGGVKLDAWTGKSPLFTIVLVIFAVVASIVLVVRDLLRMK